MILQLKVNDRVFNIDLPKGAKLELYAKPIQRDDDPVESDPPKDVYALAAEMMLENTNKVFAKVNEILKTNCPHDSHHYDVQTDTPICDLCKRPIEPSGWRVRE